MNARIAATFPIIDARQLVYLCRAGEPGGSVTDTKIIYSMIGVSKVVPPNKQVLKDISISYFYGAKIGVLGLNGAGKSTLLRILAGVDRDFEGQVQISPGYTV